MHVQGSTLRAPVSPAQEVILHLHPECTRSQQDLTLTEANKLTSLVNAVSLQSALLYFSSIDHGLVCHSKWRRSIQILSTFCFTFGYVMYCIRSTPFVLYDVIVVSYERYSPLLPLGRRVPGPHREQGCCLATKIFKLE